MRKKDLRVGADKLDVRQPDPRQSIRPPMPDRKQREQLFVPNQATVKPLICSTSTPKALQPSP